MQIQIDEKATATAIANAVEQAIGDATERHDFSAQLREAASVALDRADIVGQLTQALDKQLSTMAASLVQQVSEQAVPATVEALSTLLRHQLAQVVVMISANRFLGDEERQRRVRELLEKWDQ